MSDKKIIVVKKKKRGHHGHHGGSWKVAYADFVTAMMAFFLVMWIMGMDEGVKDLVQGYFTNPVGFKKSFSGGTNILSVGSSPVAADIQGLMLLSRRDQHKAFERTAGLIEDQLRDKGLIGEAGSDVEVVVTEEGLRIELMETGEQHIFFASGSSDLTPRLSEVLATVGTELNGLPNSVVVEGHTDGMPYGRNGFTNWELSVDRANAARRALVGGGLEGSRISEVRGYADTRLKVPSTPTDPRNRRISLLLPFKEEIRLDVVTPGGRIRDELLSEAAGAEAEAGAEAAGEGEPAADATAAAGAGVRSGTPGGGGR